MDLAGQTFGNRLVIRDKCIPSDWESLGMRVPDRKDKYKLTKCLNCGRILPALTKNLRTQPPRRCTFCSNIGNHNNLETYTNTWVTYEDYAACNIIYDGKVITFYVDIQDYNSAKNYTWRISKKRQKYYVISGSFKKGTMVYLHELVYGEREEGTEIDHIDGNSLNNRRSNLREVSRQENIDNQRATRIDNQIGIRGISYNKKSGKYVVDCAYHNSRYYMKPWDTIEEAVWCRYCFEDYFDLPAIKNNPLATQYFTLNEQNKEKIREYVISKILGNER